MKLLHSDLTKQVEKKQYDGKRLVSVCAAASMDKLSFLKNLVSNPEYHITIQTEVDGGVWKVQRTYKNFQDLRMGLLHAHPDSLIPPLPDIRINKDQT